MKKKLLTQIIALPFTLITLARLTLVEKLLIFYKDFKIPQIWVTRFHKIWPHIKPIAKPIIIGLITISKRVTSKPIMRAMSTVDHKRISVMYLLFRLFSRIMSV